ncbi:MAG: hypothetical protein JNL90_17780 [Planctomycetes bacterium]|nr:hypothetical protein [Planctomycetota bacterium]
MEPSLYPLRSIQFLAELVFPGQQWQLPDLQRLHAKCFEREATRYVNFQLVQGGAMLANPSQQQGALSAAWILPDRIRLQEQLTGLSREDFEKRLDAFARTAFAELKIPHFAATQFAVQSLASPRVAQDAVDLMSRGVLGFTPQDAQEFERPPLLMGVRMTFPTAPVDEGQFHSRIETMQRDPKTIFLENVGVFRTQIGEGEAGRLIAQFVQTYDWLREQLLGFVGRCEGRYVP